MQKPVLLLIATIEPPSESSKVKLAMDFDLLELTRLHACLAHPPNFTIASLFEVWIPWISNLNAVRSILVK